MRLLAGCVVCCLAALHPVVAMEGILDLRAIDEALAIGGVRTPRERTTFHQPYRLDVGLPPVDYIEVLTPFRRIALTAEQRKLAGDLSFGQKQALALAGATGARLELWVELSFHPLNTYVGVPAYDVTLSPGGNVDVEPTVLERIPRFGPRVEGAGLRLTIPGGSVPTVVAQPLAGGTIIATFDVHDIDENATYVVQVSERDEPLATAALNLAGLR